MKKIALFCLGLAMIAQSCSDQEDPDQNRKDLLEKQDVQIKRHLEDNSLTAEKDNLGAYVLTLTENPSGTVIEAGDVAEITYSITQLDGTPIGDNLGDSMRVAFNEKANFSPLYLYFSLAHMKEGEKKRFYLPSEAAYGNFNLGDKVPFQSIVVMEVEVKEVYKTVAELKAADIAMAERVIAANNEEADTLSPSGVRKVVLAEGEGETPDANDVVSVYYTGSYLNGDVFDTNTGASGKKFSFTIGSQTTIPGFEAAVKSLELGEKAKFYIPSTEAYGAGVIYAAPQEIREDLAKNPEFSRFNPASVKMPPHSPLVFEIELTDLVKKD